MTSISFSGGPIVTGTGERADWVVVGGDTIVGHGEGEPPRTDRSVDLDGAVLTPAFRDAHVHLPATGLYETGMDLRGVRSVDRILAGYAERVANEEMLFGGNYEDPLDRPLLAADLDEVVGERPALLVRADMHSVVASTALLRRLALGELEGVDRNDHGEPTGYLREQAAAEAYKWFESNLPRSRQVDAIRAGVAAAYRKGIAEVHEMFVIEWRGWESVGIFDEAVAPVTLEVVPYYATDDVERVVAMGSPRIGGDWFLDGSFGSHTAWMSEPYPGPVPAGSSPTGIAYRSDDEVFGFFMRAQERGLRVGVHAIGDGAIEQCIATWEKVAARVGASAVARLGHRIEHFECGTDDHIRRVAALGLRLSVQPAFDLLWGGPDKLYSDRLGWERAQVMNRFGSMAAAGIVCAAGSDSTVTPMDPFLQMRALREHHLEAERMPALDALRLNTLGPALIEGAGDRKGTIGPGLKADLALLDRHPLECGGDELAATEVLGTWIAGTRVWPPDRAEAG